MTFEDPTMLARCIKSDCSRAQAGGSPFCAEHLREQETKSAGYVEPDVEARARAAGDAAMREERGTQVLMDPDINGTSVLAAPPDPTELEPHWDGKQWVLREKRSVDIEHAKRLVRQLMIVLDIHD